MEQADQQSQSLTHAHLGEALSAGSDLAPFAYPQADHVAAIARIRFAKMDDKERASLAAPNPLYIRSPDAKLPKNGGQLT